MTGLAKNFILSAAVVSAIFFVGLSSVEAANLPAKEFCTAEKVRPSNTSKNADVYLDFWTKFRDTVMPEKPQDNNPPKEMKRPPPVKSKPAPPPREVESKPRN